MTGRVRLTERVLLTLLLFAAVAAGIALRTWHLFSEPLWLDEAYSAYAADHSLGWIWRVVPTYESHPPFYYALLHGWGAFFGRSLAGRRVPGLLAGLATVLVAGHAAGRLGSLQSLSRSRRHWLAAAAVSLAAVHPLLIEMSRQARPYAPMGLVYALALLPLLRLARDRAAGRPLAPGAVALVALAEALMLWFHSLGPLWAAALGFALLCVTVGRDLRLRDWALLVISQIAAALVWAPAALILVREAPGWVGSTWLRFDPATVPSDLGAIFATWDTGARAAALLLAGLGVAALRRDGAERRAAAALLVLALLPPLAAVLASATLAPVFLPRVLSPAALPAILLIARGAVSGTGANPLRRLAPPVALALMLVAMAHTAWQLRLPGPQQDWYRVTRWLGFRVQPGDQVWAYPNDAALPLGYALADKGQRLPVIPVPGPVPALGVRGLPAAGTRGVLRLYPADIAHLAASPRAAAAPTIWLVELTPLLYDPAGDMLRALGSHRRLAGRLAAGPIQVYGFSRSAARAAADAAR